jgi:hypothetical protein
MIDEEYDDHRCMPEIKGYKTINYASSYSVTDEQSRKVTTFRGMDGIVYDFVEIPEDKEHTKISYQPMVNTNNNSREDNSTISRVLLR